MRDINLDSRYLGIALLPVLVFLLGEWLLAQFGHVAIRVSFDSNHFNAAAEAGGRYVVYAMFTLLVAVCCSIIAVFVWDMRTHFNAASQLRLICLVAVLSLVVFVFIVLAPLIDSPKDYWFAGSNLFKDVFTQGKIESCRSSGSDWDGTLVPDKCDASWPLGLVFVRMLKLANIFVAVAAGSTIAGAISSLGTKKKNEEMSAALAREQLARLNRYLYLGSALMVCGMLLILAWLHWPDFYFSDGDSSYSTLANGLALYFGVNYSLIVFSYYAPVAFVLSQRGRASGRSEPLDLHAIFRVVFALLSPFLTGLFGTVISTVS